MEAHVHVSFLEENKKLDRGTLRCHSIKHQNTDFGKDDVRLKIFTSFARFIAPNHSFKIEWGHKIQEHKDICID